MKADMAIVLLLLLGVCTCLGAGGDGRPATRPLADRVPEGWVLPKMGLVALADLQPGRLKSDQTIVRVLAWQMEEDKRGCREENALICLRFPAADSGDNWRIAHLFRCLNGDNRDWMLFNVLDAPGFLSHADFRRPPTNEQVYAFAQATMWRFRASFDNKLLDASVCPATWREVTAEQPTRFYGRKLPASASLSRVLRPDGEEESAPHGAGNVYAPQVMIKAGVFQMWYGAQGKDGHDRILFAQSKDGIHWDRRGVAIEDATANHVNDPSVVKANGEYLMFFTRAVKGVVDEVAVATSADGLTWKAKGPVLLPGKTGEWDALSVGRPSVIFENGHFQMWYDGRKDLPVGAPAEGVPTSPNSVRSVGYATSKDGLHWEKHATNPVFGHDAGGVDVTKMGEKKFLMVYESREGTKLATSGDGLKWRDHGVWVERSGGPTDAFGHVTPHLRVWPKQQMATVYFGAASAATWDHNLIASSPVPYVEIEALLAEEEN